MKTFLVLLILLLLSGGGASLFAWAKNSPKRDPENPPNPPLPDDSQLDSFDAPAAIVSSTPARLSATEIASYAADAGFSGDDLPTAIAIALAESNVPPTNPPTGNAHAYNPEAQAKGGTPAGLGSYGLWQIYEKAHPEFEGIDLFDPSNNAIAAFSIYSSAGNSFRPWSTFTNKAYLAHLATAMDVVSA